MAKGAKETPIVTVKGTGDDNKVVLWERDAAHPDGEIFVSNDGKPRRVAMTPAVKTRLREGRLEEVDGDSDGEDEPVKSKAASNAEKKRKDKEPVDKAVAPWEGYDSATVDTITARLRDLDDAGRANVLAYERANGKRAGVIQPLVNWNS